MDTDIEVTIRVETTVDVGYKFPQDFCPENCQTCPQRQNGNGCPAEKNPVRFIETLPPDQRKIAYQALLAQEGLGRVRILR